MENQNGKRFFDNIFQELTSRVINTKTVTVKCTKNPEHKEYEAEVIVNEDGSETFLTVCPECLRDAELKAERERKISECKKANVEPEFYNKTFEDYKAETDSQKAALEAVKEVYSGNLKKIVLLGSYGTGKTMFASILARDMKGKIYSMYEISTMIRQSYTVKAEKTELEIVNELASVPFLAIDEVGRTNGSNSEKNWLSYILDKRHVRGLPFVLISNGHLSRNCPNGGCEKCFENYMDGDVISRLRQNSKVIDIVGKDYRAKK